MSKLFIFLHLPKCSGTTINMNLNKNFAKDEVLYLTEGRNMFGLSAEEYAKGTYEEKAIRYIQGLTRAEKDKIKVIFGHDVFYGVHDYFEREPYYFTFVREPFRRIISQYKQYKKTAQAMPVVFDPLSKSSFRPEKSFSENKVLSDGKLIDFSQWIRTNPGDRENMTYNLIRHGFIPTLGVPLYQKIKSLTADDFKEYLKVFSFIGTTENFDKDFTYLCQVMGIKRYYERENVSKRDKADELPPAETEELRKIFAANNPKDELLYGIVASTKIVPEKKQSTIAIFHDYFRVIGGAEKLVLTLARELGADIITAEVNGSCIAEAGFLNERIITLGSLSRFSFFLPSSCKKRFEECDFSGKYKTFIFSGNFSIYAAKKHKPNLWYCHAPLRGMYDLNKKHVE